MADLPKLKAAVAEADPRTVEPVARDYRERVRADAFVVADRQGRTLVALGTRQGVLGRVPARGGGRRPVPGRRRAAARDRGHADPDRRRGPGDPRLPDARLRAGRRSRVAPAGADRQRGGDRAGTSRVFASTLPRRFDARCSRPLRLRGHGCGWTATTTSRAASRSGAQAHAPFALVLRSRAEALRPLRTLRAALAVAALLALAVGVLLSWAVARTVTRPLAALTDAMRDIAATGDLARRIPPSQPLGRRGREAALGHLRRARRLGRALPARGRDTRPALGAGEAVDGGRARGAQPADDHQGLAARAGGGRRLARTTRARRWRTSHERSRA